MPQRGQRFFFSATACAAFMDWLFGRVGSTGDASIETRIAGDRSADAASCLWCELSKVRRSERFSGDGDDVGGWFGLECS